MERQARTIGSSLPNHGRNCRLGAFGDRVLKRGVMGHRAGFGVLFIATFLAASGLSPLPVTPLLIPAAHADEPGRTAISAVDAAFKGQMSQAQELAERSGDPAA